MENVNDRPTFGHGMPEGRQQELVLILGRVLFCTKRVPVLAFLWRDSY